MKAAAGGGVEEYEQGSSAIQINSVGEMVTELRKKPPGGGELESHPCGPEAADRSVQA